MAQPSNTAIQYAPTTSFVFLNSLDRYSNGVAPPAASNQTTCSDITYSTPGLSNISTVQLSGITLSSLWWNQTGATASVSPAFYTNLINLVDYTSGSNYLITVPYGLGNIGSVISNMAKYVQASGFGGTANGTAPIVVATSSTSTALYDPINTPAGTWITWYDTRTTSPKSLGWSRVTTAPDGTNIANRRQLFDLLGLAGHVPSLAGVAGVQGAGYSTVSWSGGGVASTVGAIRYIDVISPQLTQFAPDVNSCATASSNSIARLTGAVLTTQSFQTSGSSGKVLRVAPGATSLRIQLIDDQQNPIPTNFPVPVPYVGTIPTGTGATSTTLSNLTLSGIANANTTFPAGTQVNILTLTNAPTGWNPGVYQVQSSTSNTVVIPYTTSNANQINSSNFTFSIAPCWLTSTAGNQNGPEYTLTFTAIGRTSTG